MNANDTCSQLSMNQMKRKGQRNEKKAINCVIDSMDFLKEEKRLGIHYYIDLKKKG